MLLLFVENESSSILSLGGFINMSTQSTLTNYYISHDPYVNFKDFFHEVTGRLKSPKRMLSNFLLTLII